LDRYYVYPKDLESKEIETFSLALDLPSYPELPSTDYESITHFVDQTIFKMSKKVELATGLNVLAPYASEIYQVIF